MIFSECICVLCLACCLAGVRYLQRKISNTRGSCLNSCFHKDLYSIKLINIILLKWVKWAFEPLPDSNLMLLGLRALYVLLMLYTNTKGLTMLVENLKVMF